MARLQTEVEVEHLVVVPDQPIEALAEPAYLAVSRASSQPAVNVSS